MPPAKAPPSKKTNTTPQSRLIRDAISDLQRFHALGVNSLKKDRGRLNVSETLKRQGNRNGLHVLHKARAFAFSMPRVQLSRLLKKCEQRQFALSKTAMMQTLSIPNPADRDQFLDEMITKGWNVREAQQEMIARWGKRRVGAGRKARVPADEKELLFRLRAFAESWLRLHTAAHDIKADNGSADVLRAMKPVTAAITNLLQQIGQDVRGTVRTNAKGDLFVQLVPQDPANPRGTQTLISGKQRFTATFKNNQLCKLQRPDKSQADLAKVLQRLFPDDRNLIGKPVRFYRTDQGWVMEPMTMNSYAGTNS